MRVGLNSVFCATLLLLSIGNVFAEAKPNKVPSNPALRSELLAMAKQDQDLREKWINGPKNPKIDAEVKAVDTKNTARMKQVVSQYGWPSQSLVGKDGADAA